MTDTTPTPNPLPCGCRAELQRVYAERDHHEQQQRLLLYRDMPKLRDERDAAFKAKCDAQAAVAELERQLAALRAAAADVVATDPLTGGLSRRPAYCQESAAEYALNDCQCDLCASVRHQRKKQTLVALLASTPKETT